MQTITMVKRSGTNLSMEDPSSVESGTTKEFITTLLSQSSLRKQPRLLLIRTSIGMDLNMVITHMVELSKLLAQIQETI